jgi:hypothetical protein
VDVHQYLPAGITADFLIVLLIAGAIARIWGGHFQRSHKATRRDLAPGVLLVYIIFRSPFHCEIIICFARRHQRNVAQPLLRTRHSPLKNVAQALLPVPIIQKVRRIDTAKAV